MNTKIALFLLGAATLGGVGCAAEGPADESEAQVSEINEVAWPSALPDGRGCLSTAPLADGPHAGKNLRLEFRLVGEAVVQVYDGQTGYFVDEVAYPRARRTTGGKLSLEPAVDFFSTGRVSVLTQRRLGDGSVATELQPLDDELGRRIGTTTVPMTCDVHAGNARLVNPKAPQVVPAKPVRAGVTYPYPVPAIQPCDASAPIPSGRFQGEILRLSFAWGGVVYEVYSRETGYKREKRVYSANPLSGGGYEIGKRSARGFTTYGRAVPVAVKGETYLTFEPVGGAAEIGGNIPLSCKFLQ
jgi:hypothetical protein